MEEIGVEDLFAFRFEGGPVSSFIGVSGGVVIICFLWLANGCYYRKVVAAHGILMYSPAAL